MVIEVRKPLCLSSERLILLGAKVSVAFGMVFMPFVSAGLSDLEKRHPRRRVLVLPHPSGLCRLWNEPGAFQRARDAVRAFAPELTELIGKGSRAEAS